ncbi:Piso0_000267 [Millerozyma farinosa CBS 7064]|uniref:Dolichyl-phosphate-mannose--protein mannosyltransferase n=1 Tax=Pichia sorbitophila (strain ATCC MYA-4447 / BCRC 22081 / CBS 7064 / NBRC 10061 / NRRL Y-12695) TaxID=559304 RepID=G8YTI7_PICSO|nr:Piso0_000267 [Millerozyma farinosa CBS 7064]
MGKRKGSTGTSSSDNSDPVYEFEYGKGEFRKFLITSPPASVVKQRKMKGKEYLMLGVLLMITLYVRLWRLSQPNSVAFDEVHFGKFAKKYVLGQFFMDVHPPLAKMLFGAVATLGGFSGEFDFENIGDEFPASTPYVLMRAFPAVLGVGTVLLCYLTLKMSGCRPLVCWITSAALLFENANVTISRYILLDSPLVFFIASAVYAFKKFEIQQPFSFGWFKALIGCGIALGLSVSSKWVGLFTISWVGVACVLQMWFIIGDLTISSKQVILHVIFRGGILLGIPIVLYILFFAVHFSILPNEGDGSVFMSSAFKSTLNDNTIPKDITANVGFGSVVTIRHLETQGGYLHSHNHFYPTGSNQQQITLYPYIDSNNDWLVEPYNESIPENDFVPIVHGMKIRLKHVNTGRRLHSHDEKPPVSERDWQKEVSCYGFEGFEGDANDDFFVEIVEHKSKKGIAQNEVRALQTVFRLRHVMTGHYLFASHSKLPDWGFDQQEVTAASQGYRPFTHWYIETNVNPRINDTVKEIVNYPVPSLFSKLKETNKVMWNINQGLVEHHNWQSQPTEWPILWRGINYWVKDHRQIYLLGNAVVWWSSSLAIAAFIVHVIFSVFRWYLGAEIATEKHVFNFNWQASLYVLGWFLHYFPFFIMGRQLFLHHYLPSLYFGILALGHFFDIFVSYFMANNHTTRKIGQSLVILFLVASVIFYAYFSPLIYGNPWARKDCQHAKLLNSWDFECGTFFERVGDYSSIIETPEPSASNNNIDILEAKETPEVDSVQKAKNDEHQSDGPAESEGDTQKDSQSVVPPLAADADGTN